MRTKNRHRNRNRKKEEEDKYFNYGLQNFISKHVVTTEYNDGTVCAKSRIVIKNN
jgi:hypothetical protein